MEQDYPDEGGNYSDRNAGVRIERELRASTELLQDCVKSSCVPGLEVMTVNQIAANEAALGKA